MKILLLHPPMDGDSPPIRHTEGLGMGYIAATLRRDGHQVDMFDAFLRRLTSKETIDEIMPRDFDCLAMTAYDVHKQNVMSVARAVRKDRENTVIAVGGYLPTFTAEKLLTACPEIDLLVRGEGESVASDVFGRMSRGEDWHDAPGIAYVDNGSVTLNQLPPLIADLDSIPFPARDELKAVDPTMPALILGSRGCYHRCAFCSIPGFYALSGGRAPRFRSTANVLDEMESVIEQTGIREFVFADDNFIGPGSKNRERVFGFAEEMKKRNLDVTFTIECRVDEIDEEILKLLKDVGLVRVFLGVESGVQRQLDTFNKRVTVEQNRQAIELVQRLDLRYYTGLIMLDPYVTLPELLENIQFVQDMKLPEGRNESPLVCMSKLTLYGGTPITEKLKEEGLLREKGFDLDYRFKNPSFRMIYGATNALGSGLSKLARLVRRSE